MQVRGVNNSEVVARAVPHGHPGRLREVAVADEVRHAGIPAGIEYRAGLFADGFDHCPRVAEVKGHVCFHLPAKFPVAVEVTLVEWVL